MRKVIRAVFILESVKLKLKKKKIETYLVFWKMIFVGLLFLFWLHYDSKVHVMLSLMLCPSVVSYSLQPHELQHAKLPSPSLPPGVDSNSCPFSRWCCLTISSVTTFSSCPQAQKHKCLFQWVGSSHQMAKVLEFQLQHQSVLSMNIQGWFPLGLTDLASLYPRDSQESSPASQFEKINSLVISLFYGPTRTSIHDYWENHIFDYMDLCQQSDVSTF